MNFKKFKERRKALHALLAEGRIEDAGKQAHEWGLAIKPGGAIIVEVARPPSTPIPEGEDDALPLWPDTDRAVVEYQPVNKRLLVIRLSDDREAIMWRRGGRNHPRGARVGVKLHEMVGDTPYYEEVVE